MISNYRKIGRVLAVSYFLGFLVLLSYSWYIEPPLGGGDLRFRWILGNTLVLFIRGLIPIHVSAILFGYSLYSDSPGRITGFPEIAKFSSVLFLSLALLYTVLLEGALPAGMMLRERAVEKTRTIAELKLKARDAAARKMYPAARRYWEYALVISPEDTEARDGLDIARRAASAVAKPREEPKPAGIPPRGMSFDDFLSRAKNAFEREDFISAEHYGSMAMRMDPSHPVPKRIIAESRDNLSRSPLNRAARENIEFYRQKQLGYEMLSRGEAVAAYYHFQNLAGTRPDDPDIERYLGQATLELRKISFFLDEVPLLTETAVPGDVVFLNRSEGEFRDFLSLHRLVKAESFYALDIEGIRISRNGGVVHHFKAPYGKFIDGTLVMRCLDREEPGREFVPEYFAGESPEITPYHVPVAVNPEKLLLLAAGSTGFVKANIWNLLALADIFPVLGLDARPVHLAFFDRLFLPFSFLVLSFFSVGFGFRYRSRYLASPPAAGFVFLPLLPFLVGMIFTVYRYGVSVAPAFFLLYYGFTPALLAFLAFQGLLLFWALLFMARQVRG